MAEVPGEGNALKAEHPDLDIYDMLESLKADEWDEFCKSVVQQRDPAYSGGSGITGR